MVVSRLGCSTSKAVAFLEHLRSDVCDASLYRSGSNHCLLLMQSHKAVTSCSLICSSACVYMQYSEYFSLLALNQLNYTVMVYLFIMICQHWIYCIAFKMENIWNLKVWRWRDEDWMEKRGLEVERERLQMKAVLIFYTGSLIRTCTDTPRGRVCLYVLVCVFVQGLFKSHFIFFSVDTLSLCLDFLLFCVSLCIFMCSRCVCLCVWAGNG